MSSKVDWSSLPLGEEPDSVIAERVGYSRSYVGLRRRKLGIPAFVGLVLTQEGVPTRSVYEAKYDAYLHWKGIGHIHEPSVPGVPYIADFEIDGQYIEILGMSGFKRYDTKSDRKRQVYADAEVPVTWLTREDVDAVYKGCPVRLKFRSRYCDTCSKKTHDLVNGMCRSCNRKQWGQDNGTGATCEQCGDQFFRSAGAPDARFCSHPCYSKSLELEWLSWEEIDARLQHTSARQLAFELGIKPSALYMRLRRRQERDPKVPVIPDHRTTLTEDNVREMRRLYAEGTPQADLHRKYGVSRTTVHQIVHRKTWVHV